MKRHSLVATAVFLVFGGGALCHPPSPTPASAPIDPTRWPALIQQLGAEDFAQRQAAQKELDQTTWRQLAALQKFADAAIDPEIKARLTARLAALQEDIAANPPPISVNFKDATLTEVADTLSKALGIKLHINGVGANVRYTLSATDKPFWEVFLALSRQYGLSLQDMGGQLCLMTQGSQGWRTGLIAGPVAIIPQAITRQRTAALQNAPGTELGAENMSLYCTALIDPRVRIVKYAPLVFTEIIDDAGNTLLRRSDTPVANADLIDASGRSILPQAAYASLQIPKKAGTRIVSAKGFIQLLVQIGEEYVEIADLEKKNGQSFDVAGRTVRVSHFLVQGTPKNSSINLNMDLVSTPPNPAANLNPNGMNAATAATGVTATLIDADGKSVFTTTIRGSSSASVSGSYTAPFKIRLSVLTKTKDITIPFELKDLPLP